MNSVLVTGGCGFIGSHVTDYLLKMGCNVSIIDNMSLGTYCWNEADLQPVLFRQDITDMAACEMVFREVAPDTVIHLAAHHYIPYCQSNPYEAYRLNVQGTLNILECCHRVGTKRIFAASTGDVYPPGFEPHREVDMVGPVYTYGHTKYLMEQVCFRYASSVIDGAALIIGRLFNAAGSRETNPHLLPDVARQITEGKRVIEVGNTWPLRDFVDVQSMSSIIVDIMQVAAGVDVVNIGSGQTQKVGDVLAKLVSVLPHSVEIVSVPERQRLNDRPYLCPNVDKLVRLVGRSADPFSEETARNIFDSSMISKILSNK